MRVNRNTLIKAMSAVSGVYTPSLMPILANCVMMFTYNKLTVFATNLEVAATVKVDIEYAGEERKVCVPMRTSIEFLKSLKEGDVELEFVANTLKVKQEKTKASFALADIDMYPVSVVPSREGTEFTIIGAILKAILKKISFAISSDETRPVLCGAKIEISAGKIKIAGTDGYRLAVLNYTDPSFVVESSEVSIILPKKTISEIAKLGDEDIKIKVDKESIMFISGNTQLVSKLIDGEYPNIDNVMPKPNGNNASVEREALLQALNQASITKEIVRILFGDEIKVEAGGAIGTVQAILEPYEFTGREMALDFNERYITDALAHLSGERVSIALPESFGPILIQEVNDAGTIDYKNVVMPVRL